MPTLQDKLSQLVAKRAAIASAEADLANHLQTLFVSAGIGDMALAEGQAIADLKAQVVYAMDQGKRVDLELVGVIHPS